VNQDPVDDLLLHMLGKMPPDKRDALFVKTAQESPKEDALALWTLLRKMTTNPEMASLAQKRIDTYSTDEQIATFLLPRDRSRPLVAHKPQTKWWQFWK